MTRETKSMKREPALGDFGRRQLRAGGRSQRLRLIFIGRKFDRCAKLEGKNPVGMGQQGGMRHRAFDERRGAASDGHRDVLIVTDPKRNRAGNSGILGLKGSFYFPLFYDRSMAQITHANYPFPHRWPKSAPSSNRCLHPIKIPQPMRCLAVLPHAEADDACHWLPLFRGLITT